MSAMIDVQGLSKRYRLGVDGEREFWALQDVSFTVEPGEVVGIVGRNGAGKSTLLKILSRITEPTLGRAVLRGRVASLLEVGTGFHPDLSGRENIFLNGAILGMKRAEIAAKLDEIIAFSEIEAFIDTPVKRYSSGMYVRLAFAVAAHLEPEILVVDEVLAVGDAEFQRKCLGKMQEVSRGHGRTVLFVSHNMGAVRKLCNSAVLLERGTVALRAATEEVVARYFSSACSQPSTELISHPNRSGGMKPHFTRLEITDAKGRAESTFAPGDRVTIELQMQCLERILDPRISIGFTDLTGERLFAVANFLSDSAIPSLHGNASVTTQFELPPVLPSRYHLDIGLSDGANRRHDEIFAASALDVTESNFLGTSHPYFREMGYIMVRSDWKLNGGDQDDS
ncbi:MAG TPA: ABC transporter ATP-binding protein [Chthoniobacteraceae bacterium]|nr:ABC transporter ATP-binding protein [Chthoniobacteraceae bacterium]